MNQKEGNGQQVQGRVEPPSLDALSAAFSASVTDPHQGEIWRAAWGSCIQLVLVVEVGDADIDTVPVSPDMDLGDDETVRVDPGSPLDHPLGAWCGLRRRLPIRVLDVCIATVDPSELEAVDRGEGDGPSITSLLDERAQLWKAIADRMAELAAATWFPSNADAVDFAVMFHEHGLSPSKLASELGVAPGEVTAIARGERVPSSEQAEILSSLLNVEADRLQLVRLDQDLVWALDRPQFRRRLAERGLAEGEPNEAKWRFKVATSELPLAARATRSANERSRWMGLIETYLDEC
ncbi:helix-turn-helix domain-containing protein [Candidatus Poriferisocius sp.]|uniref:helix-turn-helix domain-containing protein n=1 Tax=Candidatus Poriferisocius sp. TaxID=3101276 RepID=UPI003B01EEF4